MNRQKVVLITGAGKGLGRTYALHFAKLGVCVVVNNRRHPGEALSSADDVVGEIASSGGRAVAEYSSVEDPDAGDNMLACAIDNFGRLDGVVANAGITEGRSFHKQSLQDFREIVEINLFGTVNVVHSAFRYMYERRHGSIVVSTSSAGLFGEFGLPAYSTSKAAVIGLMRALSHEGAARGVRINAIAPYAATQMTNEQLPQDLKARLGAEHVAPVVAWLVSDECTANGEIVVSGGGRTSRARMMSTAAIPATGFGEQQWSVLTSRALDEVDDSAVRHFERFIAGQDTGRAR